MSVASGWQCASIPVYPCRAALVNRQSFGSGQDRFILNEGHSKAIFSSFNESIRPRLLRESPFLRLPHDTIPDQRILVYKYMDDDFLNLIKNCDIVHLDIKLDNIMVNFHYTGPETLVEQVRIIELENAAYLPKGRWVKGMLAGNDSWHSPEGHFKGELSKPANIFSFATVKFESRCVPSRHSPATLGDREGLNGPMTHVGDEQVNCQVLGFLWDQAADYHSYKPFSEWPNVTEDGFKDLIRRMTNLDPTKRVTAHEALEHPWFDGYEID